MRKTTVNVLLGITLWAGVIGCDTTGEETEANTADTRQEITNSISEQNKAFMNSFREADTARFAQVYVEDGWMMPPNAEPIKGREGIKQFLLRGNEMGLRVELSSEELFVVSDSAAIETGSCKTLADEEEVDHGTFMVYWKKDGDTWRMFRDIWNSDVPPTNQQESEG